MRGGPAQRLRTILIIRSVMAVLLVALGVVVLGEGRTALGVLLLAFGVVNAVLVTVLARRRREWTRRFPGVGAGPFRRG